jgi:hypothetical protein
MPGYRRPRPWPDGEVRSDRRSVANVVEQKREKFVGMPELHSGNVGGAPQ